jgi:para-aminobenzoate synthetase component 1
MAFHSKIPIPQNDAWFFSLLQWVDQHYSHFCLFLDNQVDYPFGGFPNKIQAGQKSFSLEEVSAVFGKNELVGVISYDYKNQIEASSSLNPEIIPCSNTVFFIPEITLEWDEHFIVFQSDCELNVEGLFDGNLYSNPKVSIEALTDKEKYLQDVQAIKNHIEEGDIYEMNYCMAFVFENKSWNPLVGFLELMKVSPMPFSALFKSQNTFLISASPERFLKKDKNRLIAQPIKGTVKRGKDQEEDEALRMQLLNSEKERAENLMIVDLMRNDLSKVSLTGSVQVNELFGVYPFPRVHQMISTVSSELKENMDFREIIHATFPMGSMTGAPKIKCMELIDRYENFKRAWFSGALGYINANGDFDFNVVIRSIIFDRSLGKGYFAVGSAITFDADAALEYEECYLKASAIMEVLKK